MTILIIFFLHTWGSTSNPVKYYGLQKVEPLIFVTSSLETENNIYYKTNDYVSIPESLKEATNNKELKEYKLTEGNEEKTGDEVQNIHPVEEDSEDNSLVISFLKKVAGYVAGPSENSIMEELIQWIFRQ